jgi:hypothetical protein
MRTTITLICALLLGAISLRAHHSFDAEYDSKKPITVTGFVTKLDWINPHAYVYIDSKDESGAVRNYRIEMGPPYALARGGWKRDTLKIGDKVTVTGAAAAKDGSHAGGSMPTTSMTLASGQKLVMR